VIGELPFRVLLESLDVEEKPCNDPFSKTQFFWYDVAYVSKRIVFRAKPSPTHYIHTPRDDSRRGTAVQNASITHQKSFDPENILPSSLVLLVQILPIDYYMNLLRSAELFVIKQIPMTQSLKVNDEECLHVY
jgi:hypothetical protein